MMLIQWSGLTGCVHVFNQHMTIFLMTLCVNKDGDMLHMVLAGMEPQKASPLMDPTFWGPTHVTRGHWRASSAWSSTVFLSQAVSMVWVSSIGSSASGLYLCLYVDSLESTQQLRASRGTKAEVSRPSRNLGLREVNIVSTVFHQFKWNSHGLSLASVQREINTPLSMWVPSCVHRIGGLAGGQFKDKLP